MANTPPLGSPQGPLDDSHGSPTDERPSLWSKRWLPIAVGVAVAALAYGAGRLQGAVALSSSNQARAAEQKTWQTELATCETERGLLSARRSLSLVALSLDRRNFGVAESHRQEALQQLTQTAASGAGSVTELVAKVQALDLAVDPDPGTKREQVISVSEALDRLVAAPRRSAPAPSATSSGS